MNTTKKTSCSANGFWNSQLKDKVYSLHEPAVYCIGKGKEHKQYEYSNKVSVTSTAKTNIIVAVVSHENYTLPEVLLHIETNRGKEVRHAVCDRGYRGKKTFGNTASSYLRRH